MSAEGEEWEDYGVKALDLILASKDLEAVQEAGLLVENHGVHLS
jgi:hypothetical protein